MVLKKLPANINKRLVDLSCNTNVFEAAKPEYQDALKKSGYSHKLIYEDNNENVRAPRRNRPRKVIWYNPPFNANVTTDLGKQFLRLIDLHIPRSYRKLFNRWNVKLSYSTMPNMAQIIQSHNAKVLSPQAATPTEPGCNCRGFPCPLNGQCLTKCVIYKATASTPQLPDKHYYGQTEDTFKGRYYGHRYDLRHSDSRRTALAKYVWKSRDEGLEPEVKWQIHTKAHPYRCGSRRCDVCLTEKLVIASAVTEEPDSTLNRRYELATGCMHQTKWKYDKASGAPV